MISDNLEYSLPEIDGKDKLILELKEIIREYENRLDSKDKNFQLQFSELHNELLSKDSELLEINIEKNKLDYQVLEFQELIEENQLVRKSKDTALQIIHEDLKIQLENVKAHYNETISVRQEEIESLRSTGSQLREQLAIREKDMIQLMQRHENQIINLFNEINNKNERSDIDQMATAMKDQMTDMRKILIEKQEKLNLANVKLEEQDKLMRDLQEKNLSLDDETKRYKQMSSTDKTYQNQIEQLNENIKENKKKQMTFKGKVKSLEKQIVSLKDQVTKEQEKGKDLRNELDIREKRIDKQNILIDELRQTEKSLRQSLNRSIVVQEEQLLELKYWSHFNKCLPDLETSYINDYFSSTDQLKSTIDNLESLCTTENHIIKEKINFIVENLKSYHASLYQEIKNSHQLENKFHFLNKNLINVNKLNVNLLKNIAVLVKDNERFHNYLIDINSDVSNLELEKLEECSETELIKKLLILVNQSITYNNTLLLLEKENQHYFTELNKIGEICDKMTIKLQSAYKKTANFLNYSSDINLPVTFDKSSKEDQSLYIEQVFSWIIQEMDLINLKVEDIIPILQEEKDLYERNDLENKIFEMKTETSVKTDNINKNSKNEKKKTKGNRNNKTTKKSNNSNNDVTESPAANANFFQDINNERECDESGIKNQEAMNNKLLDLTKIVEEFKVNEINYQSELSDIKEERNNILKEFDNVKSKFEKEKETIELSNNYLNNQLMLLEKEIEESKTYEMNYKENILIISKENDHLKETFDDINKKFMIFQENNGNNVTLMHNLNHGVNKIKKIIEETLNNEIITTGNELENDIVTKNNEEEPNSFSKQLITLQKLVEDLIISSLAVKETMTSVRIEQSNTIEKLHQKKKEILIYKEEKKENDCLLKNLNDKIISLQNETDEICIKDLKYKEQIKLHIAEKETFVKVSEEMKNEIMIFIKEQEEHSSSMNDLHNQLQLLKILVEEMNKNEMRLKENIVIAEEEKQTLISNCELMKMNLVTLTKELDENRSLIVNQKIQLINLEKEIEEINANDLELKEKLKNINEEKEQILQEFDITKIREKSLIEEKENDCEFIRNIKSQLIQVNKSIEEETDVGLLDDNFDNIVEERIFVLDLCSNLTKVLVRLNKDKADIYGFKKNLDDQLIFIRGMIEENSINDNNVHGVIISNDVNNISDTFQEIKFKLQQLFMEKTENMSTIISLNDKINTIEKQLSDISKNESELKGKLQELTDENIDIMKELEESKIKVNNYNNEIENKNILVKELTENILILQTKTDEILISQSALQDELLNINNEKEKYVNEIEIAKSKEDTFFKGKEESLIAINNLNCQLEAVKLSLENMSENERKLKEQLNTITEEKHNIGDTFNSFKNEMFLIEEKNDKLKNYLYNEIIFIDMIIKGMLDQETKVNRTRINIGKYDNSAFFDQLEFSEKEATASDIQEDYKALIIELNKNLEILQGNMDGMITNESIIQEQLIKITTEKEQILQELEIFKNNENQFNYINLNNSTLINDLNEQLIVMRNMVEELKLNESKLKDEILHITKERNNVANECEEINRKVLLFANEKEQNDILMGNLKKQILLLNSSIEEMNNNEVKIKEELINITTEKDNLYKELESFKNNEIIFNKIKDDYEYLVQDSNDKLKRCQEELEKTNENEIKLNDNLGKIKSDKENLLKDLEIIKSNEEVLKCEKVDSNNLIKELSEQLNKIKEIAKDLDKNEIEYKNEILRVTEEKNSIENDMTEFENKLIILTKDKDEKDCFINDLQIQLTLLKSLVEDMSNSERKTKEELISVELEKDNLLKELESFKNYEISFNRTKDDYTSLVQNLNDKLITIQQELKEMNENELKLKEDILLIKLEKDKLLKELEISKSNGEIFQRENQNNSDLINDLTDQLSKIKEIITELNIKELQYQSEFVNIVEEKNNFIIDFEKLENELVNLKSNNYEKDLLINNLRDEMIRLNNLVENKDNSELKINEELVNLKEEKENLLNQINIYQEEKIIFAKERNENNLLINDLRNKITNFERLLEENGCNKMQFKEELAFITNERDQLLNEIEFLNIKISLADKESKQNIILVSNLIDILQNSSSTLDVRDDCKIKEKCIILTKEKSEKLEIIDHAELNDETSGIDNFHDKLLLIKSLIDKITINEKQVKDELIKVTNDRDMIGEELNHNKNKILNNENNLSNNDRLIKELNDEIQFLKQSLGELNFNETVYKKDILNLTNDRENILIELKNMKILWEKSVKEKENSDLLIIDLNNQLSSVKELVGKMIADEEKYNEDINNIMNEKHNVSVELDELKCKFNNLTNEKEENDDLMKDLTNQLVMLKEVIGEMSTKEMSFDKEKENMCKKLEELKHLIDKGNNDKDIILEELSRKNENLNMLNIKIIENESFIKEIQEQIEKSFLNVNDKQKQIDTLEKTNLILKAKLIKLKKQSEQKIVALTKEKDSLTEKSIVADINKPLKTSTCLNDLEEMSEERQFNKLNIADAYCQCNLSDVDTISMKNSPFYMSKDDLFVLSNLNLDKHDEKSLFNQIEHLSDEVDAKVRKVNFEIEEFLEHNERVTSSLISRKSSNQSTLCTDSQCQTMVNKHRELTLTIKNLQEQNQLIKNKMIDLYRCLENEQERHKQISSEDLHINEDLREKNKICMQENVQLVVQIAHLKDELKVLKKDKQKNIDKLSTLQGDMTNLTTKYNDLSIQYSNLLEEYQTTKSKISLEYSCKLDQLQSNLNLAESINIQNKNLLMELEKEKFELKKQNKKLSDENLEICRSKQLTIDEVCKQCEYYKIDNVLLNRKLSDLTSDNDKSIICIQMLTSRVKYLENFIATKDINDNSSSKDILESVLLLLNDVNNMTNLPNGFDEKYNELHQMNKAVTDLVKNCLQRAEHINKIVDELMNERNNFREIIRNLENERDYLIEEKALLGIKQSDLTKQLCSEEMEISRFSKTLKEYQLALTNERENNTELERCLTEAQESIHNYQIKVNEINQDSDDIVYPTISKMEYSPMVEEIIELTCTSIEENSCPTLIQSNLEEYVLNKLVTNFSIDKSLTEEISDNFRQTFDTYMEIIKNIKINELTNNKMSVDKIIQTNVDGIQLGKLDSEIITITKQLRSNKQTFPFINNEDQSQEIVWLTNIEAYIEAVKILQNQIIKLQNDLQYEDQKKSEISDRFEQIITELEAACDTEVEKWKLSNELLKNELHSMKIIREKQDFTLNTLKNELFDLQLKHTKYETIVEKDKYVDAVVETNDNSLLWMSDFNDALKETIAEKEDQITELMKQYNESSIRIKECQQIEESQYIEIESLKNTIAIITDQLKVKDITILDNFDVINELEVICVEKDNKINSMEKELTEINNQMEQYISAVCSMQARLEASKPNLESMLNKVDNRSNTLQLLTLIDQLEKDYSQELEQCEISKSKTEIKLNKAIQVIHKLKKQLKLYHLQVLKLTSEIDSLKLEDDRLDTKINDDKDKEEIALVNTTGFEDVSTQCDFEREDPNIDFKNIIENLHANNYVLWKELDNIKKSDRNIRGSSLPPTTTSSISTVKMFSGESERSISPVSQMSSNSIEGDSVNVNQMKDLQRKIHRTTQQLNQMRVERNRIHQEYTRIRQLKEEGDQKIMDLLKHIDSNENQDDILYEKDQLIKMNNNFSVKMVELQAEIDMTKVRNSILETKCKKMEWKLNNQRRKYDQLLLKLDEKEQELDRAFDDIRRNSSTFEKERLEWLRERKELKSLNKTKDEKITNFRKQLSTKTRDIDDKHDKDYPIEDSRENEYLSEIEQLRELLSQQKTENRRCLIKYRDDINKQKGQLEELIDDNRQLKRKLSFDQQDCKLNFSETSSMIKGGGPLMQIIDESTETSDFSLPRNNSESNTILAKVVLEKENLIKLLTEKENQLKNEHDKCDQYEKEIARLVDNKETKSTLSNPEKDVNKCIQHQLVQTEINDLDLPAENISSTDQSIQVDSYSKMSTSSFDMITQTDDLIIDSHKIASTFYNGDGQHKYIQTDKQQQEQQLLTMNDTNKDQLINYVDQNTQTLDCFQQSIINKNKQIQFEKLDFTINSPIELIHHRDLNQTSTQTETNDHYEYVLSSIKPFLISVMIQTEPDELTEKLNQEILIKNKMVENLKDQIVLEKRNGCTIERELNEAINEGGIYESKNMEYQEIISTLQLNQIEIEKRYKQHIDELNSEISKHRKSQDEKDCVLFVDKETGLTNECHLEDGWDMEWEYEKNNSEDQIHTAETSIVDIEKETLTNFIHEPNSEISYFLNKLDNMLNLNTDNVSLEEIRALRLSYPTYEDKMNNITNQPTINETNDFNLIAILRDEIFQLKQSINEKNHEIGELKCLRNQLQSELLESGQQIKDSNMEFLSLKENIQALNAEKDILIQKREDLEKRFKQLVHFNDMLSMDLRRLRDSSPLYNQPSLIDSNVIDEKIVIQITKSLEYELHKLLEQMYEKDIKLDKSLSQIEQLSCAIHRLQLHQASNIITMNETNHTKSEKSDENIVQNDNDHEEFQNLLIELSELLEKKQVEIEELKSRLFLATDQLIHFRTFFADPDYKMKKQYLPIISYDPRESLKNKVTDNLKKSHTKLLVECDDKNKFSDSEDQSVVSQDGSTIIRVEKIARNQDICCNNSLFNRLMRKIKLKNVFNRLHLATTASGNHLFRFRSQPRLNIRNIMTLYIFLIHILLFRCIFL